MRIRLGIGVIFSLASLASGQAQPGNKTTRLQSGEQPSGTLQAAINAAGAEATIVLPQGYKETATSSIAISKANVTLSCEQGATLIKGGNVTLLALRGSEETIDGCTLDGNNGAGFTGSTLSLSGSTNALVQNSTIRNAEGQNIAGSDFSGARLLNNHVYGGWNSAISFGGNASNVTIKGGLLDSTAGRSRFSSKCVELHSRGSGKAISNILMTDFTCHNGIQWAIEWGQFGKDALPTQQIHIANVHAIAERDTNGCYSAGSPSINDLIENNTCDANGFTFGIAAYEIVEQQHSVYRNNSWVENGGKIQVGISLNSSSNNILTGFNGRGWTNWNPKASSGAMYINDQYETTGSRTTNNEISSNVFTQVQGDCVIRGCNGILLKTYRDGQEISHNRIHDNVIHMLGSSSSGPYGINQGLTAGVMDTNEFSNNLIEGAYVGVQHNGETNSHFAGTQCKHCGKAKDGAPGLGTAEK
jgi:hypothetical protein